MSEVEVGEARAAKAERGERLADLSALRTKKPRSLWSDAFNQFRRHRLAMAGAIVLSVITLAVVAGPIVWPHSYAAFNFIDAYQDPSLAHPMGTDDLGRDVLSRLIHGAPATLYASFLAVGIACLIGIPIGLLAGFLGGWVDDGIGRVVDTLLSFPAIVLAIGVTGALGIGLTNGMVAIGIVFSPLLARLVRAQTLIVKQGASGCVIVTREGQTPVPGYPAEVVDTIGAGDCFAAAFVAGRLRGLTLVDAARLANAMGAATVQKAGAGRNAPTCAEVMDVLARAGERLDFPCP